MSLRRILTSAVAVLVGIALVSAVLLVLATTSLHSVTVELGGAIESIRIAEELQLNLLLLDRARDPVVRRNLESELRQLLVSAEDFVETPSETQLLEEIERRVGAYLDQGAEGSLEAAFGVLDQFTNLNAAQARAAQMRSERLDRFSNGFGIAAAILLVVIAVAIALFLNASVVRPLVAFSSSIHAYGTGDTRARAPEEGPLEIREAAENFNSLADTLERQREQQLAFLAGIAHDLRNPISALRTATALWTPERPMPPPEQAKNTMGLVRRQVDRLDRMVGDFLDAARIEAGQLELQLQQSDLRELVRASVELFGPAAPGHRLELSLPESPLVVRCDPFRIEQVLNNLLSNAIKYSPAGSVVTLSLGRSGDEAALAVSDQGIGIAPGELRRLFQPFQRTGASRESFPGVGLGLYVVRRIVEAHGWRIEVESQVGSGSTFRVLLPAREGVERLG